MTTFVEPQYSENLYRLSEAAEYYPREVGCFEVRYNRLTKPFPSLAGAFLYYLRLDVPGALWDVTEKECLIERKIPLLKGEMAEAA